MGKGRERGSGSICSFSFMIPSSTGHRISAIFLHLNYDIFFKIFVEKKVQLALITIHNASLFIVKEGFSPENLLH